jgi:hypothetical protein
MKFKSLAVGNFSSDITLSGEKFKIEKMLNRLQMHSGILNNYSKFPISTFFKSMSDDIFLVRGTTGDQSQISIKYSIHEDSNIVLKDAKVKL